MFFRLFFLTLLLSAGATELHLTSPTFTHALEASSNLCLTGYVRGSWTPPLCLNGVTAEVSRTGGFIGMIPIRPGSNELIMTLGTNTWRQTFEITSRPASPSCQTSPMLTPRDFTPPELYDLTPRTLPANCAPSNVCVWVDAGHGGSATGALSPHGWTEKEINLLTAKAFCVELEKAGFRVKMTRTNDTFCALYQRPLEATRRGADLFISIHHNACACDRDPRKIRHTVSYASNSNGLELASCLQTELARALPNIPSRGALLKSLAVCRNPVLPSCLVEVDFINLPSGEEESWQGSRLLAVAKALTRGVLSYIEGRTACDK